MVDPFLEALRTSTQPDREVLTGDSLRVRCTYETLDRMDRVAKLAANRGLTITKAHFLRAATEAYLQVIEAEFPEVLPD